MIDTAVPKLRRSVMIGEGIDDIADDRRVRYNSALSPAPAPFNPPPQVSDGRVHTDIRTYELTDGQSNQESVKKS